MFTDGRQAGARGRTSGSGNGNDSRRQKLLRTREEIARLRAELLQSAEQGRQCGRRGSASPFTGGEVGGFLLEPEAGVPGSPLQISEEIARLKAELGMLPAAEHRQPSETWATGHSSGGAKLPPGRCARPPGRCCEPRPSVDGDGGEEAAEQGGERLAQQGQMPAVMVATASCTPSPPVCFAAQETAAEIVHLMADLGMGLVRPVARRAMAAGIQLIGGEATAAEESNCTWVNLESGLAEEEVVETAVEVRQGGDHASPPTSPTDEPCGMIGRKRLPVFTGTISECDSRPTSKTAAPPPPPPQPKRLP
eukprot:COSAG01_NODE_5601_length_4153_cov_74.330291_1_plen_308_part_00